MPLSESYRKSPGSLNARCAYDVYCFGKVLLELVTGYPGFDDLKDSSINAGIENILPYISTYDKELFVKIVDPSLEVDLDQLIELWALAIIAMACLSPKPSKRPEMRYILEALEDPKSVISTVAKTKATEGMTGVGISKASANATFSDTATCGSPNSAATEIQETCPIWDIGDPNNLRVYTLQELVAATENFKRYRVLGEGGFGRVYKGQIHDKSISKGSSQSVIAIKKLNPESFQGFQEWQTEIYMLGTLSHPNLIKLLGYCQKDYNLLLVYEFMPRGSFDNHLFGRGSSIQPLQWEVRLKILIGAARALAFLHARNKLSTEISKPQTYYLIVLTMPNYQILASQGLVLKIVNHM